MDTIFSGLQGALAGWIIPYLVPIIATGLLGWAVAAWTRITGQQVDQATRDQLHQAIETAINAALIYFGVTKAQAAANPTLAADVVNMAVGTVQTTNPGTLKAKGLDNPAGTAVLKTLASSKLVPTSIAQMGPVTASTATSP